MFHVQFRIMNFEFCILLITCIFTILNFEFCILLVTCIFSTGLELRSVSTARLPPAISTFFGGSSDDDDDADRGDGGDFDYDDDIGDEYDDVSFDSSTSCCDINFILEQNTQHAEWFLLQKIILDIF